MRCTIFVIVILSVRPSVGLSVTLVDCVHMVRHTIMISSYGLPAIAELLVNLAVMRHRDAGDSCVQPIKFIKILVRS